MLEPETIPDYFAAGNSAIGEVIKLVEDLLSKDREQDLRTSVLRFKKTEAQHKVLNLSVLKEGWDSYEAPPPNRAAIRKALHILNLLDGPDLLNVRILPSAEGGVGICFVRGDRYADLECSNDGEVFGIRHTGREAPTLIPTDGSDISINAALREIREHING
jgi:hypothetical protein